jgi:hypothetical protein
MTSEGQIQAQISKIIFHHEYHLQSILIDFWLDTAGFTTLLVQMLTGTGLADRTQWLGQYVILLNKETT